MNWKTLLVGKWNWWRPLKSLAAIWLLLALFSCTMVNRILFFPPPPSYATDDPLAVSFETPKGETIYAFHRSARPGQPTLLYGHGNAEDAGQNLELLQVFAARGWGVLLYDYPGYGRSTGKPTESSCERAIDAAWKFLTQTQRVAPDSIVITGRSVGSGPAVYLAEKHDAAALVLISPFTSVFAVRSPAQYLLPGNLFPNLKRIRGIETPLLVIHGEADGVIPFSHGRKLYEASPAETKRFVPVPEAGHNDLFYLALPEILDEITRFPPRD